MASRDSVFVIFLHRNGHRKLASTDSCPCGGVVNNREPNIEQHNKTRMHLLSVGKVDEYKPQYPAIKERKERWYGVPILRD
jgi:hypothetical protein